MQVTSKVCIFQKFAPSYPSEALNYLLGFAVHVTLDTTNEKLKALLLPFH